MASGLGISAKGSVAPALASESVSLLPRSSAYQGPTEKSYTRGKDVGEDSNIPEGLGWRNAGAAKRRATADAPNCPNVLPPHCGGAVPAPLPRAGSKWRSKFPDGFDHLTAPKGLIEIR